MVYKRLVKVIPFFMAFPIMARVVSQVVKVVSQMVKVVSQVVKVFSNMKKEILVPIIFFKFYGFIVLNFHN